MLYITIYNVKEELLCLILMRQKVLQEHKNGLSIVGATEKAVDEVVKRGYKNIFYIGIGEPYSMPTRWPTS